MKFPTRGLLALAAAAAACTALAAQPAAPDLSGTTDASIRAVIRLVAHHQVHPLRDGDYTPVHSVAQAEAARQPEGIAWNYPWGVALYGVIRSYDATGDQEALNFALEHDRIVGRDYAWLQTVRGAVGEAAWQDFIHTDKDLKIGGLLRLGNLDSCGAMGAQMLEGMLRYPDQATAEEKAVVAAVADWITVRQGRLPDGTLWRPKAKDENGVWPVGTVWADDLYMACPFLVRWAQYTGDKKYLTDAARQVINMAGRLQDTDGVWFHAYSEPRKEHSPFKWGRANGWIAVASVEILSVLPPDHPLRPELLDIFRRQMAGVIRLQPESGVWHQVLDHPELWEETSCTGMFAYALARGVNRGWLPASDMEVARKAFAGICTHITPDGVVKDTCQGTNIGFKIEFYANRAHPDDDPHSRGIVQLAGTEILRAKR